MVLFWAVFDGLMTYVTPLLMEEHAFSNSMIGLIIATSSITGALFDFLICKFFKNTDFKRIFLLMFVVCFAYPLLLWQSKTVWLFLFAMAAWGVYYDFYGFGTFDFVGRYTQKKDHSSSFGMIQIFKSLGYVIAPLIAGLIIVETVDWQPFAFAWVFLGLSLAFFVSLLFLVRRHHRAGRPVGEPRRKKLITEFHLWKKLGKMMAPPLLLTFYIFFIDAFFWTLGPMYAENVGLKQFGGLFLTAYTLPALIVGWFVGSLTERFGKKHVAFTSLLAGSLILSVFFFLPDPMIAIAVVLVASFFISMAFPAINAAYADYICEAPQVEGEIEGLEDFAFNIGYVLGPLSAGIFADTFGIPGAFSILGVAGAVLAAMLLVVTPKHIIIKTKKCEL